MTQPKRQRLLIAVATCGGDQFLPDCIAGLDPLVQIVREAIEQPGIETVNTVDVVVFRKVRVKGAKVFGDPDVSGGSQASGGDRVLRAARIRVSVVFPRLITAGRPPGVDVKFDGVAKHPAKRFDNPAFQMFVVPFVEDLEQIADSHHDPNHFPGVATEIRGQTVIFAVIRNQGGEARFTDEIDPRKEILGIEGPVGLQGFMRISASTTISLPATRGS